MDDGEWKVPPKRYTEMLMVERQGLPQGYYNINNYHNNVIDASGTVLVYSPTQRPGPLSLMVSSGAV